MPSWALAARVGQPVSPEEGVQLATRKAEELRGLRLVVSRGGQSLLNQIAFDRFQFHAFLWKRPGLPRGRKRLSLCDCDGQVSAGHEATFTEDDGALDRV